jgi:hypothetical protein
MIIGTAFIKEVVTGLVVILFGMIYLFIACLFLPSDPDKQLGETLWIKYARKCSVCGEGILEKVIRKDFLYYIGNLKAIKYYDAERCTVCNKEFVTEESLVASKWKTVNQMEE